MITDNSHDRGWYSTYVKDQCRCQYCGFDGLQSKEHWLQLQGDHLIPRGAAGVFAEDELNRVIACFYCNLVKRNWDPSEGELQKIPDESVRRELINKARARIELRREENWKVGGGLKGSFETMIKDVRRFANNRTQ